MTFCGTSSTYSLVGLEQQRQPGELKIVRHYGKFHSGSNQGAKMFSAVNKDIFLIQLYPATYITFNSCRSYTGIAMLFTIALSVGFIHEVSESLFLSMILAKHN